MHAVIINLLYIAAAVLFVLGIKKLGRADSARHGNRLSSVGMLLAVVATLLYGGLAWPMVAGGLALGSVIGLVAARRVPMTAMPEMVALFNGFGGIASLLVGLVEMVKIGAAEGGSAGYLAALKATSGVSVPLWFAALAISLTVLIGGVTFTGSLVAWAKLAGHMPGRPLQFPAQLWLNGLLLAAALAAATAFTAAPLAPWAVAATLALTGLALGLGLLGTLPIGGGDMPVVIALLNSLSGVAAASAGFILLNNVLVVAGCLVGASGLILTVIMCKAMNRNLANVLFGGFGATTSGGGETAGGGELKPISPEDAYLVLEAASHVVFIPGYGMAVAQAQHAVKELASILEEKGCQVEFAIHPVAGRMPGHMNVLLAEADVPYEQLWEMDPVNRVIASADVAIVIGANDVVNPAAAEDRGSPIYGMPIINAHEAHTVFVLKRGQGKGFSGIENRLFLRPNTRMVYGDAKATLTALVAQFKGA
jgi:H+-translocating NAD(P) transhydrogenase subunit beta